ncbi:MAG: pyridoxamine 5'-phosphate oxidase [Bdellovibrionaceae bacterium]|nr:pyridoxamine 5'-phosphate oxidase [Pseudobdellovibrionaceae bacterium]
MSPIDQFNEWYRDAEKAEVVEPYAFVLSTVDGLNQPHSRVVLWRRLIDGVFYFFTNYTSNKSKDIAENTKVAMNFHWRLPFHRQIRIQGTVSKAAKEISDEYYSSRPRGSQIGAWASPQSQDIADRTVLEKLVKEFEEKFADKKEIPRPEFWGGFGITPEYFEFWQEGDSRLHNRTVYTKEKGVWVRKTIAP